MKHNGAVEKCLPGVVCLIERCVSLYVHSPSLYRKICQNAYNGRKPDLILCGKLFTTCFVSIVKESNIEAWCGVLQVSTGGIFTSCPNELAGEVVAIYLQTWPELD